MSYCLKSAQGRSLGLNERAKRTKQMLQVVNRADAACQASAEPAPFPKTPHPRATDARSRGIKFPISAWYVSATPETGNKVGVNDSGCSANKEE